MFSPQTWNKASTNSLTVGGAMWRWWVEPDMMHRCDQVEGWVATPTERSPWHLQVFSGKRQTVCKHNLHTNSWSLAVLADTSVAVLLLFLHAQVEVMVLLMSWSVSW